MSRLVGASIVQGVPPLTYTAYAKNGRVLLRQTGLKGPATMTIPRDLRKRVAWTELMDARGVIVNRWDAPWEVL